MDVCVVCLPLVFLSLSRYYATQEESAAIFLIRLKGRVQHLSLPESSLINEDPSSATSSLMASSSFFFPITFPDQSHAIHLKGNRYIIPLHHQCLVSSARLLIPSGPFLLYIPVQRTFPSFFLLQDILLNWSRNASWFLCFFLCWMLAHPSRPAVITHCAHIYTHGIGTGERGSERP